MLVVAGTGEGWVATLPHVDQCSGGEHPLADVPRRPHAAGAVVVAPGVAHCCRASSLPSCSALIGHHSVTFMVAGLASLSKQIFRTHRGPCVQSGHACRSRLHTAFCDWTELVGCAGQSAAPLAAAIAGRGAFIVDRLNNERCSCSSYLGMYFGIFTVGCRRWRRGSWSRRCFGRPSSVEAAIFLACFMMTDPPTSPIREPEQIAVGNA